MSKILYFESCGCVEYNGINCRIRTAFTNKDNKKIFIELYTGHAYSKNEKIDYLVCDSCHYITDDERIDDCNESRLYYKQTNKQIEYTAKNILNFVNKNCNCEFEEITILPTLAGYTAHSDNPKINKGYNLIDNFIYSEERTQNYIKKVDELKQYFAKLFNQKHDNTQYYVQNGALRARISVSDRKLQEVGWTKGRDINVNDI